MPDDAIDVHEAAPAATRAADLENRFGDPHDPANPVGFSALLEADEAATASAPAEALLTDFRLNAEFVPRALGGRLERMDELARVLRPVFRRDLALGLGYGITSFMAAVNIWTAGDARQQRSLADLLLSGGRAAIAYHELAHGNDFSRNALTARRVHGGFRIDGRKEVINNATRARAYTLFARTSDAPGSRSHSVLLLDRSDLPDASFRTLPRYATAGARSCDLGGLEFADCPVPASVLVGAEGAGVELALRSFQITRSVLPAAALAAADTALRTVVGFARARTLYRRPVIDIPHARDTLAAAFADLLLCDALSLVATRALHLLPQETSVLAAAVKYLVPAVLGEVMDDLSVVLGARYYLRDGEFAIFQKHLRDLPVLSLGHAGPTACQATIIPQLGRLARRSWPGAGEAPPGLFHMDGSLPPLDPGALALTSGHDTLIASLTAAADTLPSGSGPERALRGYAQALVAELGRVRKQSLALAPKDRTPLAGPGSFELSRRYALLLAASAVIGVWQHHRDTPDAFLSNASWAAAAVDRVSRRLALPVAPLPPECAHAVQQEVIARHAGGRSYDLYAESVAVAL